MVQAVQPSSWERLARNHIPGRDWNIISRRWAAAAIGFEPVAISELSDNIEPIVGPDFENRPNVSVFEFPGGHIAAFQDAAAALLKCAYVLRNVGGCLLGGQPTWASVDAYHFSLIGCRTLLAFLGIHIVRLRDTRCVLDVFPEGILSQTIRKFKQENPWLTSPARLIFRARGGVIEQREMWSILIRALNVAKLPTSIAAYVNVIRELGAGFGRSRNEMLYGSSQWLYEEDFLSPNISVEIEDDIHSYTDLTDFFDEKHANFVFAAVLVRILIALTSDLSAQSGVDLFQTSYGPCFAKFNGFDCGDLASLFASLYRKEGYGIDL
jgi:hypothetical protein